MNKRDRTDEFAAAALAPRPQRYATGDRVRVRSTGETGSVLFALCDSDSEHTMVRLDGPDNRNHRYLTVNLAREDALF
jgi:hypothetical protein